MTLCQTVISNKRTGSNKLIQFKKENKRACTLGGVKSLVLTAVFFETGAMPVPTKWQNPTICGSGDPFHS